MADPGGGGEGQQRPELAVALLSLAKEGIWAAFVLFVLSGLPLAAALLPASLQRAAGIILTLHKYSVVGVFIVLNFKGVTRVVLRDAQELKRLWKARRAKRYVEPEFRGLLHYAKSLALSLARNAVMLIEELVYIVAVIAVLFTVEWWAHFLNSDDALMNSLLTVHEGVGVLLVAVFFAKSVGRVALSEEYE